MILKDLPTMPLSPGVYTFRDVHGKPMYIGKASKLRSRVRSYFNTKHKDSRIIELVERAHSLTFEITGSEIEALILESRAIKAIQPRYNIMLRDDKQYFYVIIHGDDFPRLWISHQPAAYPDAQRIIGPFTSGAALNTTLRLLREPLPYCTCKKDHSRPCLNGSIGKCLGFCCNSMDIRRKHSKTIYRKNIKALISILEGKKDTLLKELEAGLERAVKKDNLEAAIYKRNAIAKIRFLFENARVLSDIRDQQMPDALREDTTNGLAELKEILMLKTMPERIECYDIAHMQGSHASGSMIVFWHGNPQKSEYRKFNIKEAKTDSDVAMLAEILNRRASHKEWPTPQLIVIDGGEPQIKAASASLAKTPLSEVPVIGVTKNLKHQPDHITTVDTQWPLDKFPRQAGILLARVDAEAHRFAISHYRKRHRQTISREG